jgi:predicted phage-related endonuclease
MSLTKQQLVARKKGLFGTDASMLDGTNVYHDIFWLYKTKRGEWCDILETAIHLELGHELEDYVARGYCKRKKKRVRRDNLTRWNKKHLYDGKPFLGSHVDRMVIGEKKILECKTAYSRNKWGKDGSGNIPLNYRSQIKHYCLVLGLHKVDLAVLFLPYPPSLEIHSFDFSSMELDALLEKEYHIWDCIQRGIEPEVGGTMATNSKLREDFSGSEDDLVVSTEGISKAVKRLNTVKHGIKRLNGEKLKYANRIILHMKESEALVDHQGEFIATFKSDSKGVRKLLTK